MRFLSVVLAASLALACGSGSPQQSQSQSQSRPKNAGLTDVQVFLESPLFFGSTYEAALSLDVEVTNRTATPITVRAIRVSSPQVATFAVRPVSRMFQDVVPPREMKSFPLFLTAVSNRAGRPMEPLAVRVELDVETPQGGRFKEIFNIANVAM